MLTGGTEGTMYEIANTVFDEVVFADEHDLELYNDEPYPYSAHDELYEIVGEMIHDAERAMVECAEGYKEQFLQHVRNAHETRRTK